ncbi:MAG: hypothetical protein P8Z37_18115, partial [Acidobacteriota bacterium]
GKHINPACMDEATRNPYAVMNTTAEKTSMDSSAHKNERSCHSRRRTDSEILQGDFFKISE